MGLPETAYKIATGFGSGLGESGCTCGAITGAVMVLGLVAGRTKVYESERIVYLAAKQLHDRFRSEHKAMCCRVLTRSVAWGSAQHKKLCEQYVVDAACWTDQLLRTKLREYLPDGGARQVPKRRFLHDWVKQFAVKSTQKTSGHE